MMGWVSCAFSKNESFALLNLRYLVWHFDFFKWPNFGAREPKLLFAEFCGACSA